MEYTKTLGVIDEELGDTDIEDTSDKILVQSNIWSIFDNSSKPIKFNLKRSQRDKSLDTFYKKESLLEYIKDENDILLIQVISFMLLCKFKSIFKKFSKFPSLNLNLVKKFEGNEKNFLEMIDFFANIINMSAIDKEQISHGFSFTDNDEKLKVIFKEDDYVIYSKSIFRGQAFDRLKHIFKPDKDNSNLIILCSDLYKNKKLFHNIIVDKFKPLNPCKNTYSLQISIQSYLQWFCKNANKYNKNNDWSDLFNEIEEYQNGYQGNIDYKILYLHSCARWIFEGYIVFLEKEHIISKEEKEKWLEKTDLAFKDLFEKESQNLESDDILDALNIIKELYKKDQFINEGPNIDKYSEDGETKGFLKSKGKIICIFDKNFNIKMTDILTRACNESKYEDLFKITNGKKLRISSGASYFAIKVEQLLKLFPENEI
ncbi:MAG: hypothetical protein E7222_10780 [Clostridiales bacterium]|nr:hypothetical protein [Clostridiales bacterium]